jgi:hypothetical protein
MAGATYVAEHAPVGQRVDFLDSNTTVGLFFIDGIWPLETFLVRTIWRMGMESSVLGFYYYGRSFISNQKKIWTSLPFFAKAKKKGNTSTNPLKVWKSLQFKICSSIIWSHYGSRCCMVYGQFYAMSLWKSNVYWFISSRHFIGIIRNSIFIVFGWLSDKIGRKYIMMEE